MNSKVISFLCVVPVLVWGFQWHRQIQLDHKTATVPLGATYDLVEQTMGKPSDLFETEGSGFYCYSSGFPFSLIHRLSVRLFPFREVTAETVANKKAGIFFKNLNSWKVTIAKFFLGFWVLLGSGHLAAALPYKNDRFGYSLEVPRGLALQSRRADGSEIVWQTGTFRVTVAAANNPYGIKPHELFETVRSQAGIAIVEEWKQSGEDYYLYHLVYVKNGRQFHKRVYVSGGAINSIELSYARAWEREKAPVARRILRGFRHGDLLKLHSICQPTNCLASLSKLDKAVIQLDGGCLS